MRCSKLSSPNTTSVMLSRASETVVNRKGGILVIQEPGAGFEGMYTTQLSSQQVGFQLTTCLESITIMSATGYHSNQRATSVITKFGICPPFFCNACQLDDSHASI